MATSFGPRARRSNVMRRIGPLAEYAAIPSVRYGPRPIAERCPASASLAPASTAPAPRTADWRRKSLLELLCGMFISFVDASYLRQDGQASLRVFLKDAA